MAAIPCPPSILDFESGATGPAGQREAQKASVPLAQSECPLRTGHPDNPTGVLGQLPGVRYSPPRLSHLRVCRVLQRRTIAFSPRAPAAVATGRAGREQHGRLLKDRLPGTTRWTDQVLRTRGSLRESDSDPTSATLPVRARSELSLFLYTQMVHPACSSTALHDQATRHKLKSDRELCSALDLYRAAGTTTPKIGKQPWTAAELSPAE